MCVMSALKNFVLPRISDKKDRGKTTLLKNKNKNKNECGHSMGYEA